MDNYFENSAWQSARLGKFTASEIHRLMKGGTRPMNADELTAEKQTGGKRKTIDTLFGDGALTYITEKIAEILTGESKEDAGGLRALEWGAANEHDAALSFANTNGIAVEYFGVTNPKFFPFNKYSGGSPDGLTERAVLEIKCPFVSANHIHYLTAAHNLDKRRHSDFLSRFSAEYYAQLQFNMLCTDRQKGYLISYDPRIIQHRHRLAVLHIDADSVFQSEVSMRIAEAGKIVNRALQSLDSLPSVIIASQPEQGVTLIQPA